MTSDAMITRFQTALGETNKLSDDVITKVKPVLDTMITDELRLEWLAREVSRKVNELRKQAGLRVEDRITLMVDADGDVRRAVDAQRAWLQAETLAVAIEEVPDAGWE